MRQLRTLLGAACVWCLAAGRVWPLAPEPLVPAGEVFEDIETRLADVSRASRFTAVAFSPGGRILAGASEDGTLRLWDVATGREIHRLRGHSDSVLTVAFSADGKILASGSGDRTVRLWDVATSEEIRRLPAHRHDVLGVAFSPDGKTLAAAAEDQSVRLWDLVSGRETRSLEGHSDWIRAVAFSPDGKVLASGSDDHTVRLWDVATGDEIRRLEGHRDWVLGVAFSPDSRILASASEDGSLRLWQLTEDRPARQLQADAEAVRSVAFSPDGSALASGSGGGGVRLWEVATGAEIRRLAAHSGAVRAVCFAPGGKTLASASDDRTVRLWDVITGAEIRRLEAHSLAVLTVAFSPAGETLASGSDNGVVRLWDVVTGRESLRPEAQSGAVLSVAFSPDGEHFVTGSDGGSVQLWNARTGAKIREFTGHSEAVAAVAFSPDGRTVASGSDDRSVRLWDPEFDEEAGRLDGHTDWVRAVAFSPGGKILATGAVDRTVRLWDLATGREIGRLEGHSLGVRAVAFSPAGKLLASGSSDRTVRLWEVDGGREIRRLEGHRDWVAAVAFSPDGKTLASGAWDEDRSVRLWDVASGREMDRFEEHRDRVAAVAFSPDGKLLASGSADGTIRLRSRDHGRRYRPALLLLGGQRETWIACRAGGRCLRHDDGTLIVRENDRGVIESVAPSVVGGAGRLTLEAAPRTLKVRDGEVVDFTLEVRNHGPGRAFWINVRRAAGADADPFVLHPPRTRSFLVPGETAELRCGVSTHTPYEDPRSQRAQLDLEITTAHGEPVPVDPILIHTSTPSLEWHSARWLEDAGRLTLSVSLANVGEQDLRATEFRLELAGGEVTIPSANRPDVAAGSSEVVWFAPSEGVEPTRRVTLTARTTTPPVHRWTFPRRPVRLPALPWGLYLLFGLVVAGLLLGGGGVWLLRHPLVVRLSREPAAVLALPPDQLRSARGLLGLARRLDGVLAAAGVPRRWLEEAIAFVSDADPGLRCRRLAERLGVRPEGPLAEDPALWTLPLGASFALNLDRCLVYLPGVDRPPQDLWTALLQRPETHETVTLVISTDRGHQEHFHHLACNVANLCVAPSGPELTRLLLTGDPVAELARLIAAQVALIRISPYQLGGAVRKESAFFGREQILAHVLNREPANYLVTGGRQIGKSSLLRAIDRHYRDRPQVHSLYLVLHDHDLMSDLARAVGLPRETAADDVVTRLTAADDRRHLVLIDEADLFIAYERRREYQTLRLLRSLSESGRCHFILAGFWDLYDAVTFDYQSPLKNFGETLTIGALEVDACRQLAERPMASMGLCYQSDELVERLVGATGQRANLVAIACNEILKQLGPDDRTICGEHVDRALAGDAIAGGLAGWQRLEGEGGTGSRLDRILVYATIGWTRFTLAQVLQRLDELGEKVAPQQVKRALDRLELAFVLRREKGSYRYAVPLFKEQVLVQDPEALLARELALRLGQP